MFAQKLFNDCCTQKHYKTFFIFHRYELRLGVKHVATDAQAKYEANLTKPAHAQDPNAKDPRPGAPRGAGAATAT